MLKDKKINDIFMIQFFSYGELTCEVFFGSCCNCPGFIGNSCLWKLNSGLGKLKS